MLKARTVALINLSAAAKARAVALINLSAAAKQAICIYSLKRIIISIFTSCPVCKKGNF